MDTEEINDKDDEKHKRNKWRNKTEFILSSLGYAIGIGNICRFPYLCYKNGGGAFLIPYLIMLFFCGVPLYFMETSLGQFSSCGCLTVFKISPLFKGAGLSMIVVNFIVTIYLIMLYAYPLLFLYYSFGTVLPWTKCGNDWNTPACIKVDNSTAFDNRSHVGLKSSSDEFFHNKILQISSQIEDAGSIVWPIFICNTVAWLATYSCISNGIRSVGRVVYVTTIFPLFILLVLLLRGLTLPGAMHGVWFYIWPRWDELMNFRVWCNAAIQIFYSLGPGWGGILNMASYNSFTNNNKIDSILVPLCISATSITAGFVVFSVLGFMSHKTGIPVSSVASGGLGLAFVTYPEAISLLPWPNFWAILFFLMMFFVGMSSAFVTIEAIITSICDEFPVLRRHKFAIAFFTCCIMWACSTIFTTNSGMYWLTLLDWYSVSTSIVLISIVEVTIVGWTYGAKYFLEDIEFMIKRKVSWLWFISWKFSTPAILIAIFIITIKSNAEITYNGKTYPKWTIDLGWYCCYVSMACIPLYMGYHLLYIEQGDFIQRIISSFSPSKHWGPVDNNTKLKWIREVKLRQVGGNFVKKRPHENVHLITTV